MNGEEALLTIDDFAAALHSTVKPRTVRTMIHLGQINATKIGQRYYMTRDELRRFISQCQENANQPGCSNARTTAPGSFSTKGGKSGQAMVMDFMRQQKKP
ncbi:DNA-binding protein [Aliishimia ponticola]|uniref:DNA-binding protein n=1 Tax=Aliishimia ponticola TaxID=2499833 RepID=A0A4S4NDR5_9RHOB|nr:DNA-binding protein [Aliishimia ponticola]